MTSYSYAIDGLPTHAYLEHDTRGWVAGETVPIDHWMFISTTTVPAALYPVVKPKAPHTVDAVLYDDWYPAQVVPVAPSPLENYTHPSTCRCDGCWLGGGWS
jgi:hypothetical protein